MKTSFTLRLPEELRKKIIDEADRNLMSVNQFILYTLTKSLSVNSDNPTKDDKCAS